MSQVGQEGQTWPGGLTYVFQGTIAEDATAGTHISSLTVTPGTGNEMTLIGGEVVCGNGAANVVNVFIDDGTNVIQPFILGASMNANTVVGFPTTVLPTGATQAPANAYAPYMISGTMRLVLRVSTATVSLTHSFAVALRIHGAKPTVTLADTVGTPTLTTNTDAVF